MPQTTLAARLAVYGLSEKKVSLSDLRLERNEVRYLSGVDVNLSKQVVRLKPKTIHDLKSWIGVPDEAISQVASPSVQIVQPRAKFSGNVKSVSNHPVFAASAKYFVFRDSRSINSRLVPILSKWIQEITPLIHMFLANDIHLSSGSQLVVTPDILLIFARNITIEPNASIRVQGTEMKIDCAKLVGVSPFINLASTMELSSIKIR